MALSFQCDDEGSLTLSSGYHFADDMPDNIRHGYMTLLHGIMAMLEVEPEAFLTASMYASFGADIERKVRDQDEGASSKDKNIVSFKGRMQ